MFEEPKFDEEGSLIKDSISEEEKNRRLQIGLNNDILITNCGVPLIFVINKCWKKLKLLQRKYFS